VHSIMGRRDFLLTSASAAGMGSLVDPALQPPPKSQFLLPVLKCRQTANEVVQMIGRKEWQAALEVVRGPVLGKQKVLEAFEAYAGMNSMPRVLADLYRNQAVEQLNILDERLAAVLTGRSRKVTTRRGILSISGAATNEDQSDALDAAYALIQKIDSFLSLAPATDVTEMMALSRKFSDGI
jgi:hypothetical protein